MLPVQTILHPTDFSAYSKRAFRLACMLAHDFGARLVLLHVLPPARAVSDAGLTALSELWGDDDDAHAQLRRMEEEANSGRMESLVREGDPAEMILRAAEETHCDVIVMGMHGRTALTRLLLGSVAEEVIRKAPCPVLTAKPIFGTTKVSAEKREPEQEKETVEDCFEVCTHA